MQEYKQINKSEIFLKKWISHFGNENSGNIPMIKHHQFSLSVIFWVNLSFSFHWNSHCCISCSVLSSLLVTGQISEIALSSMVEFTILSKTQVETKSFSKSFWMVEVLFLLLASFFLMGYILLLLLQLIFFPLICYSLVSVSIK